jgi:hypothetical protein
LVQPAGVTEFPVMSVNDPFVTVCAIETALVKKKAIMDKPILDRLIDCASAGFGYFKRANIRKRI